MDCIGEKSQMARKISHKKLKVAIKPIKASQRTVAKWTLNTDS
jgi:hypothetical protein